MRLGSVSGYVTPPYPSLGSRVRWVNNIIFFFFFLLKLDLMNIIFEQNHNETRDFPLLFETVFQTTPKQ